MEHTTILCLSEDAFLELVVSISKDESQQKRMRAKGTLEEAIGET